MIFFFSGETSETPASLLLISLLAQRREIVKCLSCKTLSKADLTREFSCRTCRVSIWEHVLNRNVARYKQIPGVFFKQRFIQKLPPLSLEEHRRRGTRMFK